MAEKNNKSNHDDFLELADRIKKQKDAGGTVQLADGDAEIILAEAEWVAKYKAGRSNAAKKNQNAGRKALPDDQVSESTKRVREWRKNNLKK